MLNSIINNKELIFTLARHEVQVRYKGSFLGILWSFITPLFLLIVYTFVFSVVFQVKWGLQSNSNIEFALMLFAGLIIYNLFSECISKSPVLIINNINFVKKVIFPLEVLSLSNFIAAFFHLLISFVVFVFVSIFIYSVPSMYIFYLPIILLPISLLTIGLSWFLSSLGVYLRDIQQLIGTLLTALLFLSPIFYPVEILPDSFQRIIYFNPLTPTIESVRDILILSRQPDWEIYIYNLLASLIIFFSGLKWFSLSKRSFADVL